MPPRVRLSLPAALTAAASDPRYGSTSEPTMSELFTFDPDFPVDDGTPTWPDVLDPVADVRNTTGRIAGWKSSWTV